MAIITEPMNPSFPDVYLLSIDDDVIGGEEGVANRQARELVERTAYLKKNIEELQEELRQRDERDCGVGSLYIQYPNTDDPAEKGLPGYWVPCNDDAQIYELVEKDSYPAGSLLDYASGQNITPNTIRIYRPLHSDRQILKANKTITLTDTQPNPKDWDLLTGITRVERCDFQSDWTAPDLEIGALISWKNVDYRVVGQLNYAGKYFAADGLNKPTFVLDGTAPDVSRPIIGSTFIWSNSDPKASGALSISSAENLRPSAGTQPGVHQLIFDSSRVVLSGLEGSPRTLSTVFWRRVA